jgi:hypothetical protein
MLDLTKLARQMQGISQHLTLEAAASRQRLERAQQFFIVAKTQQAELVQRQEKWRDRITFNALHQSNPFLPASIYQFPQRVTPSSLQTVPKLPQITTKSPTVI